MTAPESPQPVADDDKSHVPPLTTRVVIAEDEALIRLDLKEMLEEEGYSVVGEAGFERDTAHDGTKDGRERFDLHNLSV